MIFDNPTEEQAAKAFVLAWHDLTSREKKLDAAVVSLTFREATSSSLADLVDARDEAASAFDDAADAFKTAAEQLAQVMVEPRWFEATCDECGTIMGRFFAKPARSKDVAALCSKCGNNASTRIKHGVP
jgi:hypothetical protein